MTPPSRPPSSLFLNPPLSRPFLTVLFCSSCVEVSLLGNVLCVVAWLNGLDFMLFFALSPFYYYWKEKTQKNYPEYAKKTT